MSCHGFRGVDTRTLAAGRSSTTTARRFARRSGQSRAEGWILFLLCGACWYGPLTVADGIARCERIRDEASGRPTVEASALQSLGVLAKSVLCAFWASRAAAS